MSTVFALVFALVIATWLAWDLARVAAAIEQRQAARAAAAASQRRAEQLARQRAAAVSPTRTRRRPRLYGGPEPVDLGGARRISTHHMLLGDGVLRRDLMRGRVIEVATHYALVAWADGSVTETEQFSPDVFVDEPSAIEAADTTEAEARFERLRDRLDELEGDIDELESERREVEDEIEELAHLLEAA